MRYTIILIMSLILLGGTTATAQKKNKKQLDNFTVMVDGLGCPYCAFGLEKQLNSLKSIKNMTIDVETGQVDFSYPTSESLSKEDIVKQVDKAGYTTVSIKVVRADGTEETADYSPSKSKDEITASFHVKGNCGMCKERIEKAALSLDGVNYAKWDALTQKLEVSFDDTVLSQSDIEKAIAAIGHDTENAKAADEVYEDLHGCCQYER